MKRSQPSRFLWQQEERETTKNRRHKSRRPAQRPDPSFPSKLIIIIIMIIIRIKSLFSEDYILSAAAYLSHDTRKPVFGVCDQLRLKPACSADDTS